MIVGDLIFATGDTTTVYRVVNVDQFGSIVALPVNATAEEVSSLILQPADVTYFSVSAITDVRALQTAVTALETAVTTLESTVTTIEDDILELGTRTAALDGVPWP